MYIYYRSFVDFNKELFPTIEPTQEPITQTPTETPTQSLAQTPTQTPTQLPTLFPTISGYSYDYKDYSFNDYYDNYKSKKEVASEKKTTIIAIIVVVSVISVIISISVGIYRYRKQHRNHNSCQIKTNSIPMAVTNRIPITVTNFQTSNDYNPVKTTTKSTPPQNSQPLDNNVTFNDETHVV